MANEAVEAAVADTDNQMEMAAERVVSRALARRDLPWSDKTAEERVEILRQEVRALRTEREALENALGHISSEHYKLALDFARHRHDGSDVMVPAGNGPGGFPMGVSLRETGRKDPLA
jgi:predicted xylose isomerase-like sugar epimerase